MKPLNLFYKPLPKQDRWLPLDRHVQNLGRYLRRGTEPSGQKKVFLNLCSGLARVGVPYRVNDYAHVRARPDEVACVIGRPPALDELSGSNPIIFGPAGLDHPSDDPEVTTRRPIRKVLVPGEWARQMFEPFWGDLVEAWPVGIDTQRWSPADPGGKDVDFLIYDKINRDRANLKGSLRDPIKLFLVRRGFTVATIRYGYYRERHLRALLARSRAMIFLCESETQGLAYQQALACGVPVMAWEPGGYWKHPDYFPHKARFAPVTSVPYWDERCGVRFKGAEEFPERFEEFLGRLSAGRFAPRDYILENLTLEKCARQYLDIFERVRATL